MAIPALKSKAENPSTAHIRAKRLAALMLLILEDATDLTYSDLEEVDTYAREMLKATRDIRTGHSLPAEGLPS